MIQAGNFRSGESIEGLDKTYQGVGYGYIPGIEASVKTPIGNSAPQIARSTLEGQHAPTRL